MSIGGLGSETIVVVVEFREEAAVLESVFEFDPSSSTA